MDKRHIQSLLGGTDRQLARLVRQARRLDEFDRLLSRLLDGGLAGKVRTAAVSKERLLLVTPSAAVASRLRLDAERLLERLCREADIRIERLDVRVAQLPLEGKR